VEHHTAKVECHVGWRFAEVERRAAGWSATEWMEQECLSASVSILGVLVIGQPGSEGVEADPAMRR
jgi:hypothetical protein